MSKRNTATKKKPPPPPQEQPVTTPEDSDDEGGFSKWLQDSQDAKFIWYFVIVNSSIVFLTMTWPKIQETIEIVSDMFLD